MRNDIPSRQDEPRSVRLLAAQRYYYSRAKQVAGVQFLVAVCAPAALVLIDYWSPAARIWVAFVGLTLTVVDTALLDSIKDSYRGRGADIQERFDCYVLDIVPESPFIGSELVREDLFASGVDEVPHDTLKAWYPQAVSQLSQTLGRLVCQRTNATWDSRLRRRYAAGVLVFVCVVMILLVMLALWRQLSFGDFLLLEAIPALPFIMWGLREFQDNREASVRVERLRQFADRLWAESLNSTRNMRMESRQLQDAIYEHRRRSPLVLNWFYSLFRAGMEKEMVSSADDMVAEATNKR